MSFHLIIFETNQTILSHNNSWSECLHLHFSSSLRMQECRWAPVPNSIHNFLFFKRKSSWGDSNPQPLKLLASMLTIRPCRFPTTIYSLYQWTWIDLCFQLVCLIVIKLLRWYVNWIQSTSVSIWKKFTPVCCLSPFLISCKISNPYNVP